MRLAPLPAAPIAGELPPFERFVDPEPLPARSLKRERVLAWKAAGEERLLAQTHLAARLWKIANSNLDQIRVAEEGAGAHGPGRPEGRIAALRREASAHLKECVTLLEGVLETPAPPRLARVRLAHYLRELNPSAAIPHFRRLVTDEPPGPRREAYALDLVQLLLRAGAPREAARLFGTATGPADTPRGRLLRAIAWSYRPQGVDEDTLGRVLADCANAPPSLARAISEHAPLLLAALPIPSLSFERVLKTAPSCLRNQMPHVAAELTERLLDRGRMGSARAIREGMRRRGQPLPAELEDRVIQTAGPFVVSSGPPGNARLGRLLAQRFRFVGQCAAHAVRSAVIPLRLHADGRVSLSGEARAPSVGALVSPPGGSTLSPNALRQCLETIVPRWQLPSWRAPVELELSVSLTVGPSDQKQNPGRDPG